MALPPQGKKKRIGVFGGTFDPVHNGHLLVARTLRQYYGFDEILFIPAARPPHKAGVQTSFQHRAAMLALALENEPGTAISLLEADRPQASYTLETIQALEQDEAAQRTLIIGADTFIELHLWYGYVQLLAQVDLLVAARPGVTLAQLAQQSQRLPGHYQPLADQSGWQRLDGRTIHYFSKLEETVSSRAVRQALSTGQPVADDLPAAVYHYLCCHHLYGVSSPV